MFVIIQIECLEVEMLRQTLQQSHCTFSVSDTQDYPSSVATENAYEWVLNGFEHQRLNFILGEVISKTGFFLFLFPPSPIHASFLAKEIGSKERSAVS